MILPFLFAVLFLNLLKQEWANKVACPLLVLLFLGQIFLALEPQVLKEASAYLYGRLPMLQFPASSDSLTLLMLSLIAGVGMVVTLVSQSLVANLRERISFLSLLTMTVIGMNGLVVVQDIFSLYVFLEITTVGSLILILFHKEKDALEGAFKYLVLSLLATTMMLASIAIFLLFAGDTSFAAVAKVLQTSGKHVLVIFASALFVGGFCIKSGLVPFHGWLPDAYSSAPSPVSVLLAGIVTKTTGVYILLRIVRDVVGFTPAIQEILLLVGAISVVVGAVAALGQSDMRRMLAYSSISQVGYIILSFATGTALGVAAALFHLFNHTVFKSLLFVNACAIENKTGLRNMNEMGGLSAKMPITGTTSVIGLLSTAGVPPFAGFFSKLLILIALWQSHHFVYTVIALLTSLLTLAYFLSMQRRVFFGKLDSLRFGNLREASLWVTLPAILLAVVTTAVGLAFPFLFDTIFVPIQNFLW